MILAWSQSLPLIIVMINIILCHHHQDYGDEEMDEEDDESASSSWHANPITSLAYKKGLIIVADFEGVHIHGSSDPIYLEFLDLVIMKKIIILPLPGSTKKMILGDDEYLVIVVLYQEYANFYLLRLPRRTDLILSHGDTKLNFSLISDIYMIDRSSFDRPLGPLRLPANGYSIFILINPFNGNFIRRQAISPILLVSRHYEFDPDRQKMTYQGETVLRGSRYLSDEVQRQFIYAFTRGKYVYLIAQDVSMEDQSSLRSVCMRACRDDTSLNSSTIISLQCRSSKKPVSAFYSASNDLDENRFFVAFSTGNKGSPSSIICGYDLDKIDQVFEQERAKCYSGDGLESKIRPSPLFTSNEFCLPKSYLECGTRDNIFIESPMTFQPEPGLITEQPGAIVHLLVASYQSINYTILVLIMEGGSMIETNDRMYRLYNQTCKILTKPVFDKFQIEVHYGCDDRLISIALSTCEIFKKRPDCEKHFDGIPCFWDSDIDQCFKREEKIQIKSSREEFSDDNEYPSDDEYSELYNVQKPQNPMGHNQDSHPDESDDEYSGPLEDAPDNFSSKMGSPSHQSPHRDDPGSAFPMDSKSKNRGNSNSTNSNDFGDSHNSNLEAKSDSGNVETIGEKDKAILNEVGIVLRSDNPPTGSKDNESVADSDKTKFLLIILSILFLIMFGGLLMLVIHFCCRKTEP